ncbi:MAG: DUF4184 family protein [Acidimicrobiales bacterium]
MPFPLVSHQGLAAPALVVGRRQRLDAVAYLIGTLAPDLPYALDRTRWDFDASSHTLVGLIVWSVPVSVVATWVFRRLMASTLATQLPDVGPLRLRDLAWAASDRPGWWATAVSAMLGALTHVVFDGFTHPEAWAVDLFPVLVDPAPVSLPNPGRPTYWYDVVHAFGNYGGALLVPVCFGLGAWRRARNGRPRPQLPPSTRDERVVLAGSTLTGAVVGVGAAARVWGPETMAQGTMLFTWSVALGALGGCLLVRQYPAQVMDSSGTPDADSAGSGATSDNPEAPEEPDTSDAPAISSSSLRRMAPRTETLLAGEYFLGVQGLAMIRHCVTRPSVVKPRVQEIEGIVAHFDEFPNSLAIEMTEHDVAEGYTRWAPRYDGPNPAIRAEEPVVHGLLAGLPSGAALDAACGTGRHAAKLVELGHRVVGVDSTEAMLDVARVKVPEADFRPGRLQDLPLEDASVDLVTCALALTHVADLGPVIREFARVVRPGGRVVLSDMHPAMTMLTGIAGFPEKVSAIPYVVNLTHQVSAYLAAFRAAGLVVRDCIEPLITETVLASLPSHAVYPDATRQAFLDTPYLLIWHLEAGGS